jgi:hypothetical protein
MPRQPRAGAKPEAGGHEPRGRAAHLWSSLLDGLSADHGPFEERWAANAKTGWWTLRLVQRRGGRTVIYLTVEDTGFVAGLVLGERAAGAARDAGLSPAFLAALEAAPRYAEGRGLRVPVRTRSDVEDVRRAAALKMAR